MTIENTDRGDDVVDTTVVDDDATTTVVDEDDSLGDVVTTGDELEETPEEKAEREAHEAEELKKKRIRIPKERFDEVVNKARDREADLQRQIADLQGRLGGQKYSQDLAKVQTDIDALQEKYEDLILDGKKDEARAVRKQIDVARDVLIDAKAEAKASGATAAAIEGLKYDAQLAKIEAEHPALNPDHADFNGDKTEEVSMLMEAFLAKGFTRTAALAKAVGYVMKDAAPAAKGAGDAAQVLADKRAEEARRKAADAQKRSPAPTTKVGDDSDKAGKDGQAIDIMRMSQDKFAKLDEETKAKLRGDDI